MEKAAKILSPSFLEEGYSHVGSWTFASRFMILNSSLFLFNSLFFYFLNSSSIIGILFVPLVFLIGSLLSFLFMFLCGAVIAPIAWYALGSGIYFGLGAIAAGYQVHPYSLTKYGADTSYLLKVNLLNSLSVFLVVGSSLLVLRKNRIKEYIKVDTSSTKFLILRNILPYAIIIAILSLGLNYFYFPMADNLFIRSFVAKTSIFLPFTNFLLGSFWGYFDKKIRLMALGLLFFEITYGMLLFSKYQIIYCILSLTLGVLVFDRSIKNLLKIATIMIFAIILINPYVTLGRAHYKYNPEKNTVCDRLKIIKDVISASWGNKKQLITLEENKNKAANLNVINSPVERISALGRRIDVASVQNFLINEYDSRRPGATIANFWMAFIPRLFWPQKPVLTQAGVELQKLYFNDPSQNSSALAPTYSGEAYWNFGWGGVVVVSILLGALIGWFTNYSFKAMAGESIDYFIIAFPVILWAGFVEAWLVPTYLGDGIVLFVTLALFRLFLALLSILKRVGYI